MGILCEILRSKKMSMLIKKIRNYYLEKLYNMKLQRTKKFCNTVKPFHRSKTFVFRLATIGGGGKGKKLLPFFENRKKCRDFGKKNPDRVHPLVEFSTQNMILRVSRKKVQNFSLHFFLVCLTECLLNYLSSTKPPLL